MSNIIGTVSIQPDSIDHLQINIAGTYSSNDRKEYKVTCKWQGYYGMETWTSYPCYTLSEIAKYLKERFPNNAQVDNFLS